MDRLYQREDIHLDDPAQNDLGGRLPMPARYSDNYWIIEQITSAQRAPCFDKDAFGPACCNGVLLQQPGVELYLVYCRSDIGSGKYRGHM